MTASGEHIEKSEPEKTGQDDQTEGNTGSTETQPETGTNETEKPD